MRRKLKSYYRWLVVRPYIRVRRIGEGVVHGVKQVWAWLIAMRNAIAGFLDKFLVRPVRATWAGLKRAWAWLITAWEWMTGAGRKTTQFLDRILVRPVRGMWRMGKRLWEGRKRPQHWLQKRWAWISQALSATTNFLRYSFRQVIGWTVVVVGIILVPIPLPFGVPLILIGLFIIGTRDPRVRWLRVNTRRMLRMVERKRIPLLSSLAKKTLSLGKNRTPSGSSVPEPPEGGTLGNITQKAPVLHHSTDRAGEPLALHPDDEREP